MISSSRPVAVPIVLLCALLSDARAQSNPEKALKPEANVVLNKVRETYRTLADYHFERTLLIQEGMEDGNPANVAELTLAIASEHAKPLPDSGSFLSINLDRFVVRTKTRGNEILQMCDGRMCWSYLPLKNEYMTGQRFRDVNSSVGGSLLLGVHLFTFMTLEEGVVQQAKVAREEDIVVGNDRRKCYVIEGLIQPGPRPRANQPPPPGRPGVDWLLSILALQGLTGEQGTAYSPWPSDENAGGIGEPTRVTLWIDQTAHVVVRAKMTAPLFKVRGGKEGRTVEKVAVAVTDSFTSAAAKAPPAGMFHFTPPEGAKEVPNVASRRQKQ